MNLQVKYYVRTTGEREFEYDLKYDTFMDTEHKPIESFIKALYKISNENAVLLEDDLVLCKNFKEEIERVIAQYPTTMINFFCNPRKYYTSHFTEGFAYNQCTYYPKGISKLLADEMTKLYKLGFTPAYDTMEAKALRNLGLAYLIYRPCLVQHIDGRSIINNGKHCERNTIYFKDYLDKLNIPYENAFELKNQRKLKELLEADKKEWYK